MAAPFNSNSGFASLPGGLGSHSSLPVTLSAGNPNEVVLIHVTFTIKDVSTPTVTSITGGGLTFTKLVGPATLTNVPISPSGSGTIQCELWWAPATLAFTNTVFTVNFSAPVSLTSGNVCVQALSMSGCNTPSAPWDATAGLPASLTGAAPLSITFNNASSLSPATLNGGATLGSMIYLVDGMVGTAGDELLVALYLATKGASVGPPTTGWAQGTSYASGGGGAYPDVAFVLLSIAPTPVPPASQTVTTAELWFSQTASFVDLTNQANRRLFVSAYGGAQNLGSDGSAPFEVAPPVFLSSNGTPATFATNNGRGGAFPLTSGSLANGASNPPGTSESVTTYATGVTRWGVVGDYLTGNIYSWNPATLTDNGTRKVWRRTWRGLPKASEDAKRFASLVIGMQTGINIPEGTAPQVMLRWSDDDGSTWSDQRIVAVGGLGKTVQTVKFNRLGMTRRFGGSDRIFELTAGDYFEVAILDAEVDVS